MVHNQQFTVHIPYNTNKCSPYFGDKIQCSVARNINEATSDFVIYFWFFFSTFDYFYAGHLFGLNLSENEIGEWIFFFFGVFIFKDRNSFQLYLFNVVDNDTILIRLFDEIWTHNLFLFLLMSSHYIFLFIFSNFTFYGVCASTCVKRQPKNILCSQY